MSEHIFHIPHLEYTSHATLSWRLGTVKVSGCLGTVEVSEKYPALSRGGTHREDQHLWHSTPLSASRIVATAEDIVSADHQFLMSTGTLVHHETFNIEAIRRDLEQLIAERVCLQVAPASNSCTRMLTQHRYGEAGFQQNLHELRRAAQNAILMVFPHDQLEIGLRFERIQGTKLALTHMYCSPRYGDAWYRHWAPRVLPLEGYAFATESRPGSGDFRINTAQFLNMLGLLEVAMMGLDVSEWDLWECENPKDACTKFKRERRDVRRRIREDYGMTA